jgi:hypothetical protein
MALVGVGVGVEVFGVGVDVYNVVEVRVGVGVVSCEVANELMKYELLMSDALSNVVDVLLNVFCELMVQDLCKERLKISWIEVRSLSLCER